MQKASAPTSCLLSGRRVSRPKLLRLATPKTRCKFGKTYLPHGHFARPEEKEVRVLWHFTRLLEENVEVEEVLQGWDRTQRLQSVFVRLNLGNFALWTRLRLGPLIAPKVPLGVQPMRLERCRVK